MRASVTSMSRVMEERQSSCGRRCDSERWDIRVRQFFKTIGKSRLKMFARHPIVVAIFLVGVAK
jgi:hypothetical protein